MYQWGYLKDAIFAKLDLDENEANNMGLMNRFVVYSNEAMTQICSAVKPKRTFAFFDIHDGKYDDNGNLLENSNLETLFSMPDDFISFGDDVNTFDNGLLRRGANECDFEYVGYNQIIFHEIGKYAISYNARWFTFTNSIYNDQMINVPSDILDCIPSYVASQCMKIDDEQKAAVLRNEFEIMLARIDNTDFKSNKTFVIGGDW